MKKLAIFVPLVCLLFVGLAFTTIVNGPDASPAAESTPSDSTPAAKVVLYKDPGCGCCGMWADHMRKAGFDVEIHDLAGQALTAVKLKYGVDSKFWSCHTAVVDGYVVEGHVPADQVIKMLKEKPEIAGLAVPGMPVGSPGMEVADKSKYESYNVLAFNKKGDSTVYEHIEGGK